MDRPSASVICQEIAEIQNYPTTTIAYEALTSQVSLYCSCPEQNTRIEHTVKMYCHLPPS